MKKLDETEPSSNAKVLYLFNQNLYIQEDFRDQLRSLYFYWSLLRFLVVAY